MRPIYNSSSGGGDDFNDLWDRTQAANDGFDPLPAGTYRCLITDGRRATAKTGTESYKLTFTVIAGAFAQRKLWHDLWLTPKALARTKGALQKLRIYRPDQLRQAPPTGIVCDVRVALRTEDDGRSFNRIIGFTVVEEAPPPGTLDPDDESGEEDENDHEGEVPF
jgi:hypothetical protein